MRDILKLGTILMLYCLVAAASLAYVYVKTAPIIAANKEAKAGDSVRLEVLPGMEGGFTKQGEGTDFVYWTGFTDTGNQNLGGYVFITYGKGYSSTIETMVGVNIDGVITGIKIMFQQETPGLGDKVQQIRRGESDPWFTRQFIGKSALDDIKLVKDKSVIDAITGATISSRAVTNSINEGFKKLVEATGGKTFVKGAGSTAPAVPPKEEKPELPADDVIAQVLPAMAGGFEIKGGDTEFPYWIGYCDTGKTNAGGYAFIAKGKGFVSTIETMVGIDPAGKIIGIKVLFHEETEKYGDKIVEIREGEKDPWFTRQFIGRSVTDALAPKGDGGVIDGITGATITSKAVTESIDSGLRTIMEIITGKPYARKEKPVAAAEKKPEVKQESAGLPSDDVIATVLPDMAGGFVVQGDTTEFPYWTGYSDIEKKAKGGYAFIAKGKGFASTIETLVGVDTAGKIVGIKILSNEETQGYGDKITEVREGEKDPWFMRQFTGKSPADTIALSADGGVIDGITEATITSKAVTESIDSGLKKLMEAVKNF